MGALSIEILFAVGFLCGVQNVVGGAAYQVLLAQMAGRKRLVEANAKTALGETSAALIAPGIAGGADPAADRAVRDRARCGGLLRFGDDCCVASKDATTCRIRGVRSGVWKRDRRRDSKLVWGNRTLWALAWLAGTWQFLHHMQIAVLILFATRELRLSAGAIGFALRVRRRGLRARRPTLAQRLSARFGVGPMHRHGLIMTALGVAGLRADRRTAVVRDARARRSRCSCSTSARSCGASTTCRCARRSRPTACSDA